MTNWLFCLLFLFLCLMAFQQSFDPANLTDPHRKHLPSEDVFITWRLDARHLRGSATTDKLASYQRGQRGHQTPRVKRSETRPLRLLWAEETSRVSFLNLFCYLYMWLSDWVSKLIKPPQTLMFWIANYNSDVIGDHENIILLHFRLVQIQPRSTSEQLNQKSCYFFFKILII